MTDFGAAYAATRRRVIGLVTGLGDEEANRTVPACPEWSVRDVVAHLTGTAVDAAKGELEGVGSPEWTQRQVDERRSRPLDEVLGEWEEAGTQIDGALQYFPKAAASLFLGDTVTHEHDVRLPLNRPGERDSDAVDLAVDAYVRWLGRRLKETELPSVALRAAGREWVAGKTEPAVAVQAPSEFDLLRALTGRRTRAEIAGFEWSADPEPYLDVFSMYGMPVAPLGE